MHHNFFGRKRGQRWGALLESDDFMFSLLSASRRLALSGLAAFLVWGVVAQDALPPQGGEYALAGSLPGDQVFAKAAIGPSGGYLVWQDNFIDGQGFGIGARRLDRNLAGTLGSFQINANAAGDQEYPQIALFKDGAAIVAWQGGPVGFPKIYARFLAADGTFATADILVSTYSQGRQEHPQVSVLKDQSVVVVWSSYGQDGSYAGVYGQRLSSKGVKIGGEFIVNQRTLLNQRTPALAALADGSFVVAWVSEKELHIGTPAVDPDTGRPDGVTQVGAPQPYDVSVFARLFNADGPVGDEFKVNTSTYVAANPAVSAGASGGFVVAWSIHVGRVDLGATVSAHGWDFAVRAFGADGFPASDETVVNERTFGDQFLPSLTPSGTEWLAVWISLGQDGSMEGIYGRVLAANGLPRGTEFRVNSTTAGPQKLPGVASDGTGRCLVTWSGALGGLASFDLFAQRYSASEQLRAPAKPMVSALSASKLSVTWPDLADLGASAYEVYVDGASVPVPVTANYWTVAQLPAGSTHSFRLAYVDKKGQHSPVSDPASETTWGDDGNFDGLPDDWQAKYWGPDSYSWPAASADSDKDGASNLQEFLAGTDPSNSLSVLRMGWKTTEVGTRLTWNTEKGCIYQVQVSYDLRKWESFGSPRFAAGNSDSIPANQASGKAIYRVIRVR